MNGQIDSLEASERHDGKRSLVRPLSDGLGTTMTMCNTIKLTSAR